MRKTGQQEPIHTVSVSVFSNKDSLFSHLCLIDASKCPYPPPPALKLNPPLQSWEVFMMNDWSVRLFIKKFGLGRYPRFSKQARLKMSGKPYIGPALVVDETDASLRPVYEVNHQHLCLAVDLERETVAGFTELELTPVEGVAALRVLPVHARQIHISRVTVNGAAVEFEFYSYLDRVDAGSDLSVAALNVTWRSNCAYSNAGELFVKVPEREVPKNPPRSAHAAFAAGPEPPVRVATSGSTMHLRIYYELARPLGGLRFAGGAMYTERQPLGGRMWVPSLDFPYERHPWSLELWVPAACMAVCSGELLEQVLTADGA